MEINARKKDAMLIFDLIGELDLYCSEDVKEMIRKHIDAGEIHILLNLKDLTYLDSSGLGALIWNLQYVRKKNGFIRLCNLNGSPKHILELSNAIRLFSVFNNEEEAMII